MNVSRMRVTRGALATLVAASLLSTDAVFAQSAGNADDDALDEVLVTARKRGQAESVQDVPLAVTAFGAEQLEGRHVEDLQGLSFSTPNVMLDDVGTQKGVANFTIRGLGINSSIPSVDPTVGTFVDGVYMGINGGVVLDFFDVESVEILRGPQGILFGRNVTGGAVLIRTRAPSDEFSANFKVSSTDDMDRVIAASVSGPIGGDTFKARLTGYHNDDGGYFTNTFNGNDEFGQSQFWLVRPSFSFTPSERVDFTVRLETGELDGDDSTPGQNRALFSRDSFDIALNEEGLVNVEWQQAIAELNVDVGFGDGTITNILGWRDYEARQTLDVDSTPNTAFHANSKTFQDQLSNELRYAGTFGRVGITTGVFYFTQDLQYLENRRVISALGLLNSTMGGVQDHDTFGVFSQADIALSDAWILNLGLRYSEEDKEVASSRFIPTTNPALSGCNFDAEVCTPDFVHSDSWDDVTPKLGLQWKGSDDMQAYAFWTKGFRSGGYNLRNTSNRNAQGQFVNPPGPTDQEEVNAYEIGVKVDWPGNRVRTNFAVFLNDITDMQRELNLPGPAGVEQVIRNTADATIQGFELEAQAQLGGGFLLTGSYGYTDGEYDEILFDISGATGVINEVDYALRIPRLVDNTYGVGIMHEARLGTTELSTRINFFHRDDSAYTDNNLGILSEADMLDASISLAFMEGKLGLSLFGRNLLDEVTEGNDTQLPDIAPFGGDGPAGPRPPPTFSPLNKGRVYGAELSYRF
jgi:iron complex outermembrane recepter protein